MRLTILGTVLIISVGYGLFSGIHQTTSNKPVPIPPAAPGASPMAPRPIQDNVIAYSTADQTMQAAKQTGKSTLPRFRELIAAGTPGTYTVKFPLTQNGETEHIWLQMDSYRDGKFMGRLANTPVNGNKYRIGDRMTVAEADVEDWMIRTANAIHGGYTARAALKDMPKADADKYRAMFRD